MWNDSTYIIGSGTTSGNITSGTMASQTITIDSSSLDDLLTSPITLGGTLGPGSTGTGTTTITNGTGGYAGGYVYTDTTTPWITTSPLITRDANSHQLEVSGDTNIKGKLKVDGVDIGDAIARIESRLAILRTRPELEERWESLRALGDQYRELEKDILEQEKIYEILKR